MIYRPAPFYIPLPRRRFLQAAAAASAGFLLPGYLVEALTLTPEVTQGPFYPLARNIPLDDDNDLLFLNGSTTAASGIVTYLSGRVLDAGGQPVKDALVELWHADHAGHYIYSSGHDRNAAADPNFQGFGQFLTGAGGQYLFRTVKAGLYEGRTRHFHLAVTIPGQPERRTSQTFWNETARDDQGNPWETQNGDDMVLGGISDDAQRGSLLLNYAPVDGVTNAVGAVFDFVVGRTPVEPTRLASGSVLLPGTEVPGPNGASRYRLTIPAYAGYTYEVYTNPTVAETAWAAVPFALTQTGEVDRNRHTAAGEGPLSVYVDAKALKGRYHVSFRVPGANTGTP